MNQQQLRTTIHDRFGIKEPRVPIGFMPGRAPRPHAVSPSAVPTLERFLPAAPRTRQAPRLGQADALAGIAAFKSPEPPPVPGAEAVPLAVPTLPIRMPQAMLSPYLHVPPARELGRIAADPGLVRAVEEALLAGGLWRPEDIAGTCATTACSAGAALEALSRRGQAVMLALGHWRSRRRDATLLEDGRNASARMLGGLLHGLSLNVAQASGLLGLAEDEVAAAPAVLIRQSLAIEVGPSTYRCPDRIRGDIVARHGPAPLTDLGRRVLDALSVGGPQRKSAAADAVGIGRGSANRMIDRLVSEGWVADLGDERYALA